MSFSKKNIIYREFLETFEKLLKINYYFVRSVHLSVCPSICPSVRVEELRSYWKNFDLI